ncbi:hypothetical protein BH18ACI1_BH18ACI1_21400 [soil metagenome]
MNNSPEISEFEKTTVATVVITLVLLFKAKQIRN